MPTTRTEHDSLGEIEIPADRLWGAQTQRALAHFAVGREKMPREILGAYALIKKSCALANASLGEITPQQAGLIVRVCDEILGGRLDGHFPLPPWISGSGTQFNMNVNEVIANRASELDNEAVGSHSPLHPNDHVNRSQSSNDTFPTALHVGAALALQRALIPALQQLEFATAHKASLWAGLVKVGRTHLMDAVPMTAGQEWSAFASQLAACRADVEHALAGLYPLPLGGTALGTGIGAPAGFAARAVNQLANFSGLPFCPADNRFALQASHDALARVSAALRTLASVLFKIANDIRLLASGPLCGFSELILPENEPGSSIMPGKVNPTQCEMLAMVALQAIANDHAVALGNAAGSLQLNVYKPLIGRNLIESANLLGDAMASFRQYLIDGCVPDEARMADYSDRALMRVTALSVHIGYEKAAQIARFALTRRIPLRDAALQMGVAPELFDRVCDAYRMTQPPDA
ncbi:class II fumarate hydratase [Crenobacter intestini]|uniref:Fumarate hydratase class II n=1 Tax=Crenobacter intestini TaxID=2563443 RepID=A0A4T0UMG8_9NEIS|nr:class II fumarate hydratase [Crenobacter intestini]TIC79848.1 class II fumarate hydratase [Crenobacter intestini]